MDFERLTDSYWKQQVLRLESSRKAIVDRGDAAATGRVVPDEESLAFGTGRRMDMAVMFIDISAFSSRPCDSLAEQDLMLRCLNLFFTEMTRVAEDYGGVLEKNTGDGLMAYFLDETGARRPPRRP